MQRWGPQTQCWFNILLQFYFIAKEFRLVNFYPLQAVSESKPFFPKKTHLIFLNLFFFFVSPISAFFLFKRKNDQTFFFFHFMKKISRFVKSRFNTEFCDFFLVNWPELPLLYSQRIFHSLYSSVQQSREQYSTAYILSGLVWFALLCRRRPRRRVLSCRSLWKPVSAGCS